MLVFEPAGGLTWHKASDVLTIDKSEPVHQVSDWCSGAAAYFGWMREAKRENTRCGL